MTPTLVGRHVALVPLAIDRVPDQRKRGGIARRIVRGALAAGLAVIVVRLDIGRTTRQQHAVERVEQPVERLGHGIVAEFGTHGRYDDRQGTDRTDHCLDVLVAHRVVPAAAAIFLQAGRDADQGAQ